MPENCEYPVYEIEHWMGLNKMSLIIKMAVNTVDTHIIGHYVILCVTCSTYSALPPLQGCKYQL